MALIIVVLCYVFIGVAWGKYAIGKQREMCEKDGVRCSTYMYAVVFVVNGVLWPISMFIAWKTGSI